MSLKRHNADVTKRHFSRVFWPSLNKFYTNVNVICYLFSYMFTYIFICLSIVNIKKDNDIERHFKNYAEK